MSSKPQLHLFELLEMEVARHKSHSQRDYFQIKVKDATQSALTSKPDSSSQKNSVAPRGQSSYSRLT